MKRRERTTIRTSNCEPVKISELRNQKALIEKLSKLGTSWSPSFPPGWIPCNEPVCVGGALEPVEKASDGPATVVRHLPQVSHESGKLAPSNQLVQKGLRGGIAEAALVPQGATAYVAPLDPDGSNRGSRAQGQHSYGRRLSGPVGTKKTENWATRNVRNRSSIAANVPNRLPRCFRIQHSHPHLIGISLSKRVYHPSFLQVKTASFFLFLCKRSVNRIF